MLVRLVVTIPAYNEEKTIGDVIREVPRDIQGIESVEVLVVDDGSTEDTVTEARNAGADYVISHRKNEGLGFAFRNGLDSALEIGADVIVNIDADGQYDPAEIPALIRPIVENGVDVVLGWRDIDSLDFMPTGKKVGNKLATLLTRVVSGMAVKDAQTGFRAFSREAALRINVSGKYTYVQETIMQAKYKALKIEQVPVRFRARPGRSRLIPNLMTYARRAGKIMVTTYWHYHPLRVFALIGATFTLIGAALGIRLAVHFAQTGMVSPHLPLAVATALLIVSGIQTMILGLFAETMKAQRMFQEEILYRMKKMELANHSGGNTPPFGPSRSQPTRPMQLS